MAIGNAASKAKRNAQKPKKGEPGEEEARVAPLSGYADRATTLRLYVKDKSLVKEVKLAALQDEVSLSQLWEDWALDWLQNRH